MTKLREKTHDPFFGGALLLAAALLAIIANNSPFAAMYEHLIHTTLTIPIGKMAMSKPLVTWINDGLMSIFFLLVGLEIKREVLKGVLSDVQVLILPLVTACVGLLVPALIYIVLNYGDPIAMKGWAVPAATDIAFALAILSLLGDRIPVSGKIFLTALATIDDIGAIIIIAFFYTTQISIVSLLICLFVVALLILANRMGIRQIGIYLLLGAILWLAAVKSGVHGTIAGIVLGFLIPIDDPKVPGRSPLVELEKALFPWVTFAILPIFAFANSGFSFEGISLSKLAHPIPLGIAVGLFLGKQWGIFLSAVLLVKSGWAKLPTDVSWSQLYGIALICGIGFTMSLFIADLAFSNQAAEYARLVRIGVLSGSALSAIVGYCWLRHTS